MPNDWLFLRFKGLQGSPGVTEVSLHKLTVSFPLIVKLIYDGKHFSGHTLLDSTNSDISVSVEWCLPLPEFLQCTWILIVPNDDVFCLLLLSKGRALPVELDSAN